MRPKADNRVCVKEFQGDPGVVITLPTRKHFYRLAKALTDLMERNRSESHWQEGEVDCIGRMLNEVWDRPGDANLTAKGWGEVTREISDWEVDQLQALMRAQEEAGMTMPGFDD